MEETKTTGVKHTGKKGAEPKSADEEVLALREQIVGAIGTGWPSFISSIAFLIMVAGLVLAALGRVEARLRINMGDQLLTAAQGMQSGQTLWIESQKRSARLVATAPAVRDSMMALGEEPDDQMARLEIIRRLEGHLLTKDAPTAAIVLDTEGKALARLAPPRITADEFPIEQRQRFDRVLEGASEVYIGFVSHTVRDGAPGVDIIVAVPIQRRDGRVLGVYLTQFDPTDRLHQIASLGRVGRSGRSYIFDSAGAMLAVAPRGLEPLGPHQHPGVESELVQKTAHGQPGLFLEDLEDAVGTKLLGASVWDSRHLLGSGVEIEEREVFELYDEVKRAILASLFAVSVLCLSLLFLLNNARRRMTRGIDLTRARLESTIAERTAALAELNHDLRRESEQRMRHAWELERIRGELEEANHKLAELASTDALTGLKNRRVFDEILSKEWQRAQREMRPISLLLIDIDHFKALNDTLGHPAGDEALRRIGAILRDGAFAQRAGDAIARIGGEEFGILLENSTAEDAEEIAQLIRRALHRAAIPNPKTRVPGREIVTVSIGISSLVPREGDDPGLLTTLADRALYRAKHRGRDRVVVFRGDHLESEEILH